MSGPRFLDKVPRGAGATLVTFINDSQSNDGELLDGDPDEPATYDEAKIPEEHWFEPCEGSAQSRSRALLDYLAKDGLTVDGAIGIRQDLEAFGAISPVLRSEVSGGILSSRPETGPRTPDSAARRVKHSTTPCARLQSLKELRNRVAFA